jgi:hypothetical protein
MRTSLCLGRDLSKEVDHTAALVREKRATVIRLAIRAGLPLVASRFQAPRPEGYFADAYPLPKERRGLEAAMSRQKQRPER